MFVFGLEYATDYDNSLRSTVFLYLHVRILQFIDKK